MDEITNASQTYSTDVLTKEPMKSVAEAIIKDNRQCSRT